MSPSIQALLIVVLLVGLGALAKFPSSLKQCPRQDKNGCLRQAIEDAIRTLAQGIPIAGLPSLNPLKIPELLIGAGNSAVKLEQKFKDWGLYGLEDVNVTSADINFDTNTLKMKLLFHKAETKAQYETTGTILLLPVKGKGASIQVLHNFVNDFNMPFEVSQKKGKDHLNFVNCSVKIDVSFLELNFENLFDGNPELSLALNNTLNENWKELFQDIRGAYEDAFCVVVSGIINRFCGKVPVDEIFAAD